MPNVVKCRNCGAKFRVKVELAGRRIKCRRCGVTFDVPASGESEDPQGAALPNISTADESPGVPQSSRYRTRRSRSGSRSVAVCVLSGVLLIAGLGLWLLVPWTTDDQAGDASRDKRTVSSKNENRKPKSPPSVPPHPKKPASEKNGKSEAQERLLFCSNHGSALWSIYSMTADGRTRRRISQGSHTEVDPSWSPDGKRILFATVDRRDPASKHSPAQMSICTANADGTERKVLASVERMALSPAWSPDGKRIAFTVHAELGKIDIDVMDSDGTNRRRLVEGGESPAWSPDGNQIAYIDLYEEQGALYSTTVDGSRRARRIAYLGKPQLQAPSWSPDGKRIVCTDAGLHGGEFASKLYVLSASTGRLERTISPRNTGVIFGPRWSNHGQRIYFTHMLTKKLSQSRFDLGPPRCFVVNRDGSGEFMFPNDNTDSSDAFGRLGTDWIVVPRF